MSNTRKPPPMPPKRYMGRVATTRMVVPLGLKDTVAALIKNYSEAPLSEVERNLAERAAWRRFQSSQKQARYRARLKERKENA